ncbi:MAG: peroxiredoxin-like family protein [Pseudomonadota bacterium]
MPELLPRTPAPALTFQTLDGPFDLSTCAPRHFTMIVVYRGLHCGICKKQLQQLEAMLEDFTAAGIQAVAVSSDPEEKAAQARDTWGLPNLPIGYDLPFSVAKDWSLFISNARKAGEPETFFEPGLFLVRGNGELFFASIQNMPFGRSDLAEVLAWAKKSIDNDIPARGEVSAAQF